MAEILRHDTYTDGGFKSSHVLSDFNNSGVDMMNVTFGFNRNPDSDVDRWEIDGQTMTIEEESINANTVSIQGVRHLINDNPVDVVCFTPDFRQQTFISCAVQGVDQTVPIAGSDQDGGFSSGGTGTISYTGTEGNLLIVAVATQNDRTFTASGVTEQHSLTADGDIGGCFVGYVEATGSSQTIGATWTGGGDNYRVMVLEVTASIPTFVGGKVEIGETAVEGATVRAIRQGAASGVGVIQGTTTSDVNGDWELAVPDEELYHCVVEFTDTAGDFGPAGTRYTGDQTIKGSPWNISPAGGE